MATGTAIGSNFAPDPSNPTDASVELVNVIPEVIKETKEGYKTTEFWVSIVAAALVVFDVVPASSDTEGVIVGLISAFYAISRGLAKKGVPLIEPAKTGA